MNNSAADSTLQDGIYFNLPPEASAPKTMVLRPEAFRLLVIDVLSDDRDAARESIGRVWTTVGDLRRGIVRDLVASRPADEEQPIDPRTFDPLIGYGASFFDPERRLTTAERPELLVPLGHPGAPFPNLPWGQDVSARSGEGDLCLQLTGRDSHAVARATVEAWKVIRDEGLPLRIREAHDGFARDDKRSWIGFHDGISNVRRENRRQAIECTGDPDWNRGGTYLAFLRCQVDLEAWQALPRESQEVLVGRDKLNGSALRRVKAEDGQLVPEPFPPGDQGLGEDEAFVDPPETGDPIVETSHIHRANQNRVEPSTPAGHRIFRQGFEYLEGFEAGQPRLGLNFVSFQRDLEHLRQILGLSSWLGGVNFGGRTNRGPGEPEPIELIGLRAGGFYAVPPRADPFPGEGLLG